LYTLYRRIIISWGAGFAPPITPIRPSRLSVRPRARGAPVQLDHTSYTAGAGRTYATGGEGYFWDDHCEQQTSKRENEFPLERMYMPCTDMSRLIYRWPDGPDDFDGSDGSQAAGPTTPAARSTVPAPAAGRTSAAPGPTVVSAAAACPSPKAVGSACDPSASAVVLEELRFPAATVSARARALDAGWLPARCAT